jgi:hypothetical protein
VTLAGVGVCGPGLHADSFSGIRRRRDRRFCSQQCSAFARQKPSIREAQVGRSVEGSTRVEFYQARLSTCGSPGCGWCRYVAGCRCVYGSSLWAGLAR